MTQGLILFAHGARDPSWAAPFEDLARRIAGRQPQLALRLAYLEFMSPDLTTAAAELVAGGCTRVDLVPVFLGSGGHVRKDLPRLLEALRVEHSATRFELHSALGEVDNVLQAMAEAALAALHSEPAQ